MITYVWMAYAFSLPRSAAIDWFALISFLLIGVLVLLLGPWARQTKAVFVAFYVPIAFAALFFAGLMTACSMGDCL